MKFEAETFEIDSWPKPTWLEGKNKIKIFKILVQTYQSLYICYQRQKKICPAVGKRNENYWGV